jgi:hypothetical protein
MAGRWGFSAWHSSSLCLTHGLLVWWRADLAIGTFWFDNPERMHQDLLGEAATEVLRRVIMMMMMRRRRRRRMMMMMMIIITITPMFMSYTFFHVLNADMVTQVLDYVG